MSARKTIVGALSAVCVTAVVMVLASSSALAAEPVVTTETPSEVTETGAVLPGTIKPEDHEITECRFEYEQDNGLPPVYDEQVACQQSPAEINASSNNGSEPVFVSAELSNLTPRSKYHARLSVSTAAASSLGAGVEFLTTVAAVTTGGATEVTETSTVLRGTVNPEGQEVVECRFGYESEYAFGFGGFYGERVSCEQSVAEINALGKGGTGTVAVSAKLTSLSPRQNYGARLVIVTATGVSRSAGIEFYTRATPDIAEQSTTNVTSTEATVRASIESGGLSANYRVEYGTTGSYGSNTQEVSIGAPRFPVTVEVPLHNLDPGVEYHFRVIAMNALGSGMGADSTFITTGNVGPASSVLPDGRVEELVSPAEGSQSVYDQQTGETGNFEEDLVSSEPVRAAVNGDAVVYGGEPSSDEGNGAFGRGQANQILATRSVSGWSAHDVTPATTNANDQYVYFSADLTTGLLISDVPVPSASPTAPPGCFGLYSLHEGGYHALFTETTTAHKCGIPRPGGMTNSGSHVLFSTIAALTPGSHPAGPEGAEERPERREENLYDSVAGSVRQVNILPDGEPEQVPTASFGAPATEGENFPDLTDDISTDGTRVFWSTSIHSKETGSEGYGLVPKALYVRENDAMPQSPIGHGGECLDSGDACTIQVDAGEPACVKAGECESGGGRFWGASSDGSRVFFTDCAKLTADSTAVPGKQCVRLVDDSNQPYPISLGSDLYEYNLDTGELTDLTVDHNGAPLNADVQGVVGISEGGDYVYFVAGGALSRGAQTRECEQNEVQGEEQAEEMKEEKQGVVPAHHGCNLYVWHDGEISFIGTLLYADNSLNPIFGSGASPRGDWRGSMGERLAQVTPDGRTLVFTSTSRLTGYENRGFREVFTYDAVDKVIECASCDPSGAPPSVGSASGIGAFLPSVHLLYGAAYMGRMISNDGSRVFFETRQPLVPWDANGLQDVYEWERGGSGSCHSDVKEGCIYLLSGGQSGDNSYLLDDDATGDNVFFTSREKLVPQANGKIVLYDARVDGGFPETSAACTGTGCQGVPPAPPIFATPSSVTFNGVGNFPPPGKPAVKRRSKPAKRCRKNFVNKRGRCVKVKKAKKARTSAGRSNRRGG